MKYIINARYGGFSVNKEWCKKRGFDRDDNSLRTNRELIEAIENGENVDGAYSKLRVVEIPDEATDFRVFEYDGLEQLIYVLDGKMISTWDEDENED